MATVREMRKWKPMFEILHITRNMTAMQEVLLGLGYTMTNVLLSERKAKERPKAEARVN